MTVVVSIYARRAGHLGRAAESSNGVAGRRRRPGVDAAETAQERHAAAADDLGKQPDEDKTDREQDDTLIDGADIGLKADRREEYGAEDHVGIDIHLAFDIFGILQRTQDDACDVSAGDVGDSEVPLCAVRQYEAQRKTDDRNAALVFPALVDDLEYAVEDVSANYADKEEYAGHKEGAADIIGRISHAHGDGKHEDADYIIDDSGRYDRRSHEFGKLSQFLQRLDGDGNRSRSEDETDKQCAIEILTSPRRKSVKTHEKQSTCSKGNEHTEARDQQRLETGLAKVGDACLKACRKHQKYDAYLSHLAQEIRITDDAQDRRTDKKTCDYLARDLGSFQFTGHESEELGRYYDYRQ